MVKNKTTITFYGGIDEIGGNKILVQDSDTKVFFDFGMSYSLKKQFYAPPFLSPKTEKSLQELGILPKIDGIYKFDEKAPKVNAIFISHGHMDHSAYLSFIDREIPVYCGETTHTILQALSEIRKADLEFNVEGINFKTFRTGDKIAIDNIEIEPIHVDHSIPGAYGFIIRTQAGSIVYTGDFRAHGAKPEMTTEFAQKAKEAEPRAIITEATNMTGAYISSETEVENKIDKIVAQAEGLVLTDFAHTDVDRLNSFNKISRKRGRCLAISLRQAYLIEALCKDRKLCLPKLGDENILIFRKSKKKYEKWEEQLINKYQNKIVDSFEVSKRQSKIILALSFYDLEELVEIKPKAGSCYILSASEPFNEEMEIDFERLLNWLKHYGLPQYHAHVSGHIMPLQLKTILKEVNAKRVFPVHTEDAELLIKFMGNLKGELIRPVKGEIYTIS
ncbi:MAG: MBL fold metallo-hydrolase [Candidatus Bathyarchaeia archaeon]